MRDANGANYSSLNLPVLALGVMKASDFADGELADAVNDAPDDGFRYDATLGETGGYIFNLKTTGLSTGTYVLVFRVGADPTAHAVQFKVR